MHLASSYSRMKYIQKFQNWQKKTEVDLDGIRFQLDENVTNDKKCFIVAEKFWLGKAEI